MKWLSLGLFALLGACAPLSIYYKPGVEITRLETDTTQCQVQAVQEVPPNNQIRQSPPVFVPGRRYCNSGGCFYGDPFWAEGQVYTVDTNAPLRGKVTDQCMAAKGYAPVRVPLCPLGAVPPPGQTTRLPQLGPNSCAIRYSGGGFQIVEVQ